MQPGDVVYIVTTTVGKARFKVHQLDPPTPSSHPQTSVCMYV